MPHNPEKESPRPERKLPSSPEEEGFTRRIELIDGHPICDRCLAGIHDHPSPDEHRGEKRVDCKNVGYIDKTDERRYQCHCGFGGQSKDGKWESWEEEDERRYQRHCGFDGQPKDGKWEAREEPGEEKE